MHFNSKHIKRILMAGVVGIAGISTALVCGSQIKTAGAEGSLPVLTVNVQGEGNVTVSSKDNTYSVSKNNTLKQAFAENTELTVQASANKEIDSVSENGTKTDKYEIWDNNYFTFATKSKDTVLDIVLKDKGDGIASKMEDDAFSVDEEGTMSDEYVQEKSAELQEGISDDDRAMLEAYSKGNYDNEGYKEIRLERGKELGLDKYQDEDGFLGYSFFTSKDFATQRKGEEILIKWDSNGSYSVDLKNSKKKSAKKSRSAVMATSLAGDPSKWVVNSVTLFNFHAVGGNINNGSFSVRNTQTGQVLSGLCGDGWAAAPILGQSLGAPMTAEEAVAEHKIAKQKYPNEIWGEGNATWLRKATYYGYGGPGYSQWKAQLVANHNTTYHPEWTNDNYIGIISSAISSDALGNYTSNPEMVFASGDFETYSQARSTSWNFMMNLPDPPKNYEVYVFPNTATAGAAEGHYYGAHTRQPVVAGAIRVNRQSRGNLNLSKTFDGSNKRVESVSYLTTKVKDEYKDYVEKSTSTEEKEVEEKTDSAKTESPKKYYEILKNKDGKTYIRLTDTEKNTSEVVAPEDFYVTEKQTDLMSGSVQFKVTYATNVVDANDSSKVLHHAGDPVTIVNTNKTGIYTPDENGELQLKGFQLNYNGETKVKVQEISAHENYQVESKSQVFTFITGDDGESQKTYYPVDNKSDSGKFDNKVITIHTTATNAEVEGGKQLNDSTIVQIKDKVSYTNLTVGKEYKMSGKLMDKETKEPVLVNGKPVTAETTFTPEKPDGIVELIFEFDASDLGGHNVVVFEDLYNVETNHVISTHEDIDDEDQTVEIYKSELRTTATVDDKHEVEVPKDGNVVLVDKVEYKGVLPNHKYKVSGILMDKSTGKPVLVNGKEVTAEKSFTLGKNTEGYVNVEYKFNASGLKGHELVVFETMTHVVGDIYIPKADDAEETDKDTDKNTSKDEKTDSKTQDPALAGAEDKDKKDESENETDKIEKVAIVAEHKDLEDKGQTIKFFPDKPETGAGNDSTPYIIGGCAVIVLLAAVGFATCKKNKKSSDKE